jgi:integrase
MGSASSRGLPVGGLESGGFTETFDSRDAALSRQAEIEGQVKRNTYLPPKARPTVTKVAEAWLANKRQRWPATVAGWEYHVYRHIEPRIGEVRIDLVEPSDVERFRDSMLRADEPLAPVTINKILTTLTAIFKLAMRDYPNLVKRNPAALADRLRPRASDELRSTDESSDDDPLSISEKEVPTPEEAGRFIASVPAGLFRTWLATAVLTGMRSSEFLALHWRHVDLNGSVPSKVVGPKIMVRRVVSWVRTREDGDRPNAPRFFPPKTKASRRDIPIPSPLVEALRAWRRDCPTPLGLVFPRPGGTTVMHRKILYDQGLLPAIKAARLRHFTIHSLRHSFASSLAAAGRPPTEIAGYLGHSSADVTLRVYSHWFPKDRTGAIEQHAARVLGGAATTTGSSNR